MKYFIPFLILIIVINCKPSPATPTGEVAEKAMVVSARKEASEIGVEILKKGGNAFDAMVGTDLALAVAYPF
ncbi:MAG: gamma-glutamyltransferase, partial [Eudoraea sp.]|nr:gamma-glutamyltransferase [Eudoraea sp.]